MVRTGSTGTSTRVRSGSSYALWSTADDARQHAEQLAARSFSVLERSRRTRAEAQLIRQRARRTRGLPVPVPSSDGAGAGAPPAGTGRISGNRQPVMADCLPGFKLDCPPLEVCARVLGLDGLALLLSPGRGLPELVHCSGQLGRRLEDLQMVHGQGPTYDAAEDSAHVAVPDLAASGPARWPGLPPALRSLGVRAVFAFPVSLGSRALGVLSGHRRAPGDLTPDRYGDAQDLADTIALAIAHDPHWLAAQDALPFAPVHQATGALAARLGISPDEALSRLRAHALSHDRSALSTARAVLHHQLLLDGEADAHS
ncbi:hypothetical protein C3486_04860 [Streptomyces sp. Ru73]|uniref:ANTAR domain-containing protein n=1 Tax=Streptomyces sp. Ru73 TaxID=2080748 RepID=UPI000CDD8BB8|nr:ANTAR domain-containing protein [Streptomyces sp. Ru73]POX42346.1 hypothetical protein C3486_04860 [Streptomyces sp. Ru73]